MNDQLLSIIIPCYNDHRYIKKAVDSAIAQNWENKEVIIVDDGSNAETKDVLRELRSDVDQLIIQENLGVSSARNKGIEKAHGDYILVLDSDDYFEPNFAGKAIDVITENPEVKIVTCYTRWFNNRSEKLFKPVGGGVRNFLLSNAATGTAMFRKADWEKSGGYDINMLSGFEDWEFYLRLLKDSGHAYVIPEVLFNYRNKSNSRNKKANLTKYEIYEYIYQKHEKLYKEHFSFFTKEWLKNIKKSEKYKAAVINSLDYKVGSILLKPFRLLGLFKK